MEQKADLIRGNYFAQDLRLRSTGEQEGEASEGSSRIIEGYAIVFGMRSTELYREPGGSVYEVIEQGAVTRELLDRSDIKMTMFHDRQLILARSVNGTGTLGYEVDDHGVRFWFEAPATADGDKAVELVKRGDLRGCSFAFGFEADEEAVEVETIQAETGSETIIHIRRIDAIFDFTLAADPAYPDTSVALREMVGNREAERLQEKINDTIINQKSATEMEDNPTKVEEQTKRSLTQLVREALNANPRRAEFIISAREVTETAGGTQGSVVTVSEADKGSLVPLRVQDIIDDIEEGLIYDKIGIPLSHSNSGEFVWPSWTAGSAQIIGETEEIAPSTLNISKLTARPERFSVAFGVSYESLYQTEGVVENIVRKALALAAQRGINTALLSPEKPAGSASLQGPLVEAIKKPVSLSATPSFKELNGLKAKLLATGLAMTPVWVMSAATYCDLEATPKDAGSGIMTIENDKLCGYPVFVSHQVGDGVVALGDWSYQPSGFFGEMRLIVDPYTDSRKNMINFVLNFGFATSTLRPEAFVVGKKKA